MMKKKSSHSTYRCQSCGKDASRWFGQCPGCSEWGTIVEELSAASPEVDEFDAMINADYGSTPIPLCEVSTGDAKHRPSGINELDRVLGGGIVPGGTILLGGEPGIGKSTLLLQLLQSVARSGSGSGGSLLVTAEESVEQVRLRADRLGQLNPRGFVVAHESVGSIIKSMRDLRPSVVAVDSIQTIRDTRLESAAGTVAQVRESAGVLVREAKALNMALVLTGHVTKDGSLAGPRVLEHLVDVVLNFEGDRHHALRVLRSAKNRFGATGELGFFEMRQEGLVEVPDAFGLLVGRRNVDTPGNAVACTIEGQRSLLVELQALVSSAGSGVPRRSVTGIDINRINVLCGVLDKRLGMQCAHCDVFVSVAGGMRLSDPATDLGAAIAIASSFTERPVPVDMVFIGEVGLGGDVRPVAHLDRRLREAVRFGYRRIVISEAAAAATVKDLGQLDPDVEIIGVDTVAQALEVL